MEKRLRISDIDAERRVVMNDVHNESTPGKDFNEKYEGRLKYIDDSPKLTADEKFLVKERITRNKDTRVQNMHVRQIHVNGMVIPLAYANTAIAML